MRCPAMCYLVILFMVFWLAIFVNVKAARADCTSDGFHVELGVGYHDKSVDEPEFTLDNPLGIVGVRYQFGGFAASLEHTSGITEYEAGYGANVFSIRYDILNLFRR